MAVTGSVIAAATIGSAIFQGKAIKAQNKAQAKSARIERRLAEIENARRARRAIAQSRIQQADITAASELAGIGGSSAAVGAAGSVASKTAGAVGGAADITAGRFAQSVALQKGARDSAKFQQVASLFQATSSLASAFGSFKLADKTGTK